MLADPAAPPEILESLWSNADGTLAGGQMLKDGDRCTVVKLHAHGRDFALKRYNLKDALHSTVHGFMRSRARWCWQNGRMLKAAGVPTPAALAILEERSAWLVRRRSFLLTEFVAGRSLREALLEPELKADELKRLADQFSRIWRELGHLRIGHGDMKATNFIVDEQHRLWLIDLDGMRVYRAGPRLRYARRKDLERFMRNWQERPEVAAAFRTRLGTW